MTTNAIDRKKVVIASDSRWSYMENGHLVFVDDTGFDKIAWRGAGAMICAGDGVLIDVWKKWFLQPVLDPGQIPPTERIKPDHSVVSLDVTLLQAGTGTVLFIKGSYLTLDQEAFFAGTGAQAAHECFTTNRCAKKSVDSAKLKDIQTGGDTKFVELASGTHNLNPVGKTLTDAENELKTRGYAMNLTTKNVIPFSSYLASQGNAQSQVPPATASNLSAPTSQDIRPWTDEDKQRLRDAVTQMIDSESKTD